MFCVVVIFKICRMQRYKEEIRMDFYNIPIGFGMALAMNPPAFNAYSAMTEEEKRAVIAKAHNARSQQEMHEIVNSIAR